MTGIGELSVSITARTQKAIRNVNMFRSSMNSLPRSIGTAVKSMTGLATAAAGLVGVASVGNEIRKSFSRIDDLAKTADKLGVATEKLTALRFAAEESGVAASTADMALQRMVRRIAEAGQGSGEAVGALQELGLSAQRLAAMAPDEQFARIADAMQNVSNQGDRVRLSMKLFDSEGVALVNTLRLGSKGLAEYEAEAKRLGLTVSRFDAEQIEKANDAFGRIGKSVEGITNKIAIGLAPHIEAVAKGISEWVVSSQVSSDGITKSMKGIAMSVAFVKDGIDFWIHSFKSVRAYVSELFAWMIKKVDQLNKAIGDAFGIDTTEGINAYITTLASSMEQEAIAARAAAEKAWNKPLAMDRVETSFAKMARNLQDARKEQEKREAEREQRRQAEMLGKNLDKVAQKTKSIIGGSAAGFASFGLMLQDGLATIETASEKMAKTLRSPQSMSRENPGIVNANTEEGFAALRSSMNRKGVQEKILQEQKRETTATEQVAAAIGDLAAKILPPEILGFDS